ncbi:DNA polymerase I [Longibacter salinarum]|uniref:DNA polymerase I n=1 Tax=Longibacter salinarum TaxID=1850348 RepID=A0A2A8D312_9BACT|nr:DNA polymerase I [Longibacter salinarum]PEN15271.1 DNA polymerase I [Longibacter salinarum]
MENLVHESSNGDGNTLYLIDAMALAYRAHYIFISRPLINSKGQNTSASYGFTNSLLKLINDQEIDHIAVVFDAVGAGGTFREDIYEDYKAHRDPPPEELLENLPFIKEIVQAMDIPVVEMEGVEADDVIGTLARNAEEDGAEVVIVSPDKDFKQLLSERVRIYKPARGDQDFEIITDDDFREEYGLDPTQFVDMLALWGDSSDNVPGVPNIGEKTSMKYLKKYHDVEGCIDNADEIGGKRGQNLVEFADDARMSKELVRIKTDLDVALDWHTLLAAQPKMEKLKVLFSELEFESLLDRFDVEVEEADEVEEGENLEFDFGPYEEVKTIDADAVDYSFLKNRHELEQFVETLTEQERYAFDTETTSTDPHYASLVGMSFAWEDGVAVYVPTPMPDGTSTDDVLDLIGPILERETTKIAHNMKYDMLVMRRHGVELGGPVLDTMVGHYLFAPEENHNLNDVARSVLNYKMVPITELIGEGASQVSMRDVEVKEAARYACEDADITLQVAEKLEEKLQEVDLNEVADDIEYPLVRVLADMEFVGIRVDTDVLDRISERLAGELDELEGRIYELAGEEFNINSPQQLGEILFEKLDMPVISKTSTGNPSTKESVLQELSTDHEIPGLVLDWRKTYKLKSTYLDSLGELVHPETGRIHTSFNQTRTATGRLSSSDPNLQNIPVRTAVGREIREAFVPQDDWQLLAADYAQIELRILASMSGDEAMQETFRTGGDIHTDAAARVYGIDPADVTRDQRRKAKEVNYGIPYGVSPWGLAQRLRVPVGEAQDLITQYQKSYPGVSTLLNQLVEKARQNGYAETMLGRRRYIPEIDSSNSNRRSWAERVAVNMPIQGTQADMIKIAMNRVHERLASEALEARMLLQVHDELVFEMPPAEEAALRTLVEEEMRDALPLDGVPVVVDIDAGDNWLDAH